jgi:chaperonin cofactor prefoldin
MSDYDREVTRLNIIYDMVKAIETYTSPTDKLITITSNTSPKGNIEINAQIQRDENVYNFNTEVIYAGGYNIQRLHYRYITKTNIPKTGNNVVASEYAAKIKGLSKIEKLNKELESYEIRLKNQERTVEDRLKMTEDDIINYMKNDPHEKWYEWPTWEEIVKRDAAKNYNNDEKYYYRQQEESERAKIASWKNIKIKSLVDNNLSLKKQIEKLKAKISQML